MGRKKKLYKHFKRQTSKTFQEKTWTWLEKGSFKRDTDSLQIAAQKTP